MISVFLLYIPVLVLQRSHLDSNINSSFFLKRVIYNAGRIFTYGILGVVMSSIGELFQITKLQSILSISLGVVMNLAGITGFGMMGLPFLTKHMAAFHVVIKKLFSSFLRGN